MKKTFLLSFSFALLAMAMLSSCKKDNEVVTLQATICDFDNPSTKTHIEVLTPEGGSPEYWVNWNNNDKVMINGTEYTLALNGNTASIVGVTANDDQDGGYYAFYPAGRATSNGSDVAGWPTQIILPQVQNYVVENGKQVVEAPIAAYCSNSQSRPSLRFKNLCSLLRIEMPSSFDPTTKEVAYITVSSSNTPLWGVATISGTTTPSLSAPNISSLAATDNTVTLDFTQNGLSGSTGTGSGSSNSGATGVHSSGPFYIVLPSVTNVQELTIRIYIFDGTNSSNRRTVLMYEKVGSNPVGIESNCIYGTGTLPTTTTPVDDVPYPNLGTGEFTVGATRTGGTFLNPTYSYKKVRFAQGNLQYRASTGTWRFAPHQWTVIGNTLSNRNPSSTQSDWMDLFGYGTSGVTYNGHTYYPYSSSTNTSYYATGNIYYTGYDWGVNEISNGGNQPNKWRTLSKAEWYYLCNSRPSASNLQKNNVWLSGVPGTVFLPDVFAGSAYSTYRTNSYWENITPEQWEQVSAMGAVFIPNRTGIRVGSTISYLGSGVNQGFYWTSSCESGNTYPSILWMQNNGESFWDGLSSYKNFAGCAVRLVRDVN